VNVTQLITEDEGFSPNAYDDSTGRLIAPGYTVVGHPTVGYGVRLDGAGLTEEECAWLRDRRINKAQMEALGFPWFPVLNPPRQAVVVSMVYQLGLAGVRGFKKMIAALKVDNYEVAAKEMCFSRWATQTPLRAERLATIMRTGRWPS
jgi:lysozyme